MTQSLMGAALICSVLLLTGCAAPEGQSGAADRGGLMSLDRADLPTFDEIDGLSIDNDRKKIILALLDEAAKPGQYIKTLDWLKALIFKPGQAVPTDYHALYMRLLWGGREAIPEFKRTAAAWFVYLTLRYSYAAARCDDKGVNAENLRTMRRVFADIERYLLAASLADRQQFYRFAILSIDALPAHVSDYDVCTQGIGYGLRYMDKHGEEGLTITKRGNVTNVQFGIDRELYEFIDDAEWMKRKREINDTVRKHIGLDLQI